MNLNSEDILKLKNSAVDLAFDAIAFIDINMKINYVNQSFVKLFEFESADEIINKKTVFDFTDAENWTDEQMRNIIENIRQKGFYKFETKCATQKNKILKLQVNSSLLKTDKQEILGFVGIFHNVTDLENYYNSLLESEQKFKIIVDNVNEIVWLKDELAEKIIYVNKKYEEIYGKSIQSLYADAMSFMDKVFPADAEKIFKAYRRFLETGEIFIEQGRIYGPNNEIKWLEVKLVAIKDEDGRIVKSVGIAKDITDLKESIEKLDSQNQQLRAIEQQLRASNQQLLAVNQQLTASEQQLRAMNQQLHAKEENLKKQNAELLQLNKKLQQSETKYKNLIENMNEGLWVIDAQAKTIFVNPKLQEILGYKAEEMLGKTPFDFMPEAKKEDSENKLKTERRTGQGQHFETEFIKKNGEIVIVLMNTTPLFEDGKYAGAMAAMVDITERKNLEKQFLESEKSATVGQLAAGVAHEFNNLLTMIFNNIQLLQTDEYKNSQELLKEIENTVRRGAGIVSNLMAFAKPNKPNKDIVKIERLVNDIINIQKYYMTLENIEVDTHFENTEEVFVDTTQIQHLLLNLFINARHAILPKNRGKIKVKTFSDKDKVVIIIEDTGIGIKNEDLSKIFLPFFRQRVYGIKTASIQNII